MIKKKLGLLATSAFIIGLVGCNNNDEAFEGDERIGTVNVSDNTDNMNDMGNRSYGPFARQITTRNENVPNVYNGDRYHDIADNDFDFDFVPDRKMNDDDFLGMTISSSKTNIDSNDYPHTKAIAVQEAKYKYITANSKEEAKQQAQQYIEQQKQQGMEKANQLVQQYQNSRTQNQQNNQVNKEERQAQIQQEKANEQQAPRQEEVEKQPAKNEQAQAPNQQAQAPNQQAENQQKEAKQPAQNMSQAVQQVIDLTNAERRKNGLPELTGDTQLNGVAQKKSEDMRQNNYFSHTSPTYGSPFDMMRDFGVSYKTAGENIAQGQQTPAAVVQAWMNSEGHRKNILSKDFTHIGVGYDKNGHHWTQMFIGK
ncbi:CAP domain-containing protein [Bacillus weihaiensis]|uniref:CAP domain-containing protein n=1 Tax=Bacillus weihaiensis TaxID=1547283 RepID=UPI0023526B54|nr:CAP domain-containing protein [Bacillus weihaiensis]